MNDKQEPQKSCKTCVHKDLPGTSTICRACWCYLGRWLNWKPVEKGERDDTRRGR